MGTKHNNQGRALSERVVTLIERTTKDDVPARLGFAVVAALPDDARMKVAAALARTVVEAHEPDFAPRLEGPAAAEVYEWLAIHDVAAGEGKNDGEEVTS